ncbi:MAG: hypothetical protein LBD99_01815 [Candidatus Margulisbacteria bacterium]|jgi:hypothetical protein|nr:hypothetical protein [Candidatus Margulisiibacteriota bacterium]
MSDNFIYDPLAELNKAVYVPPAAPWSERRAEIYPKFEYFAKIVARYVNDPAVTAELERIRGKLNYAEKKETRAG